MRLHNRPLTAPALLVIMLVAVGVMAHAADAPTPVKLLDKSLDDFRVVWWKNIAEPPRTDAEAWRITDGVLHGLGRGTWLISKRDYGDFVLEFDWKIGKGANGGVGLRFPPEGDPAFRGMEIQMVDGDIYYKEKGSPDQLTGSIYDEVAASKRADKPTGEWNHYKITCKGPQVTIVLNGETVVDADLSKHTTAKNGSGGAPLAERPRTGRIGFQNLSGELTIRDVQITELK